MGQGEDTLEKLGVQSRVFFKGPFAPESPSLQRTFSPIELDGGGCQVHHYWMHFQKRKKEVGEGGEISFSISFLSTASWKVEEVFRRSGTRVGGRGGRLLEI